MSDASRRRDLEPTRDQDHARRWLIPHPHQLEICGAPRSLSWPDVCANCGAPARQRLRLRKAFYGRGARHSYPDVPGYRVIAADVPYCDACVARHRDTLPRVSFLKRWGWCLFNPAHLATIGFAVMLVAVGPDLVARLSAEPTSRLGWGILGVLVFGVVWTPAIVWWFTRPHRFEPRSEITTACDISNDVGWFYEGRRHLYAFRNQAFAEAFARANQARVWTPQDQSRMKRTHGSLALLFLATLLVAWVLMRYYQGR